MCLEDENVICRKTTIGIDDVDKRRRRRGGNTMSNNDDDDDKKDEILKRYPYKHVNNVLDFGPPKLSQQALHTILKNARGDPDACATTEETMWCARRQKTISGSLHVSVLYERILIIKKGSLLLIPWRGRVGQNGGRGGAWMK